MFNLKNIFPLTMVKFIFCKQPPFCVDFCVAYTIININDDINEVALHLVFHFHHVTQGVCKESKQMVKELFIDITKIQPNVNHLSQP